MILVIDNTFNKDRYFPKLLSVIRKHSKYPVMIISTFSEFKKIDPSEITAVILSGSPLMVTSQYLQKNIEQFMMNLYIIMHLNVPILGICFGCQLINASFGGTLEKLPKHFCKDASMSIEGKSNQKVRFCLRYVISTVGDQVKVIGKAKINEHNSVPCLIRHQYKPIYGCLFHPEYHEHTQKYIIQYVSNLLPPM